MLPSTPPAPKFVRLAAAGAAQGDDGSAGRHRGASEDGTVSVSALLAAAGLESGAGRRSRRRAVGDVVDVVVPRQPDAPRAEEADADTETMRTGRRPAAVRPGARPATITPARRAGADPAAPAVATHPAATSEPDDEAAVTDLVALPGAEPGGGPVPGVLGLLVGLLALGGALALAVLPSLGAAALIGALGSTAAVVAVLGAALVGGACAVVGLAPARRARPVALAGLVASGLALLMVALPVIALHVL